MPVLHFAISEKLPKNKNIFTKMWLGIVRFFTSFGEQAYSSTNTNPEHLQVSVNRSRQHLEIMQLLINEQFTPQTGIEVDLSLMPDQTKISACECVRGFSRCSDGR